MMDYSKETMCCDGSLRTLSRQGRLESPLPTLQLTRLVDTQQQQQQPPH